MERWRNTSWIIAGIISSAAAEVSRGPPSPTAHSLTYTPPLLLHSSFITSVCLSLSWFFPRPSQFVPVFLDTLIIKIVFCCAVNYGHSSGDNGLLLALFSVLAVSYYSLKKFADQDFVDEKICTHPTINRNAACT